MKAETDYTWIGILLFMAIWFSGIMISGAINNQAEAEYLSGITAEERAEIEAEEEFKKLAQEKIDQENADRWNSAFNTPIGNILGIELTILNMIYIVGFLFCVYVGVKVVFYV